MIKAWVFDLTRLVGKIVLSPFFRIHAHGLEHIPDQQGFILLVKHQRWEDIPVLGLAVSRPLYYVAKRELFENRIINWYLRSLGGVPLDRDKPLRTKQSFREIHEILQSGKGIVVFPEGTYYKDQMGPLRIGMLKFFLKRSDSPFIPVGIEYRQNGLKTDVDVRFGKPIWAKGCGSHEEFMNKVAKAIASLSGLYPLSEDSDESTGRYVSFIGGKGNNE